MNILRVEDYFKCHKLSEIAIRTKLLKTGIILLKDVICGAKVAFVYGDDLVIDGGYVPYPDDVEAIEGMRRDILSVHLVTRIPRLPPPPIVFDIDEVKLLIPSNHNPDPITDPFFDEDNPEENANLAMMVDAALVHLQQLLNETAPFRVRAPESCRSSGGSGLSFLVFFAITSPYRNYMLMIIKLHMDYVDNCMNIDKTFARRLCEKYGFADLDDAFAHFYRVMTRFHDNMIIQGVEKPRPYKIASRMLTHRMFDDEFLGPRIKDALHESRNMEMRLLNRYK